VTAARTETVAKADLKLSKRKRCRRLGLSRSTFYQKKVLADRDEKSFALIQRVFIERRERVGARQIKMLIQRKFDVVMSRKKIARIMRLRGLVTKIRRPKWNRRFMQRQHEHRVAANELNRNFNRKNPDEVYGTDITELSYAGRKAYLTVVKDLATKEIVASQVSKSVDVRTVSKTVEKSLQKLDENERSKLMIHSDQGFQFTHLTFRKMLSENRVTQSMSRRGNCLDNAPVESFFGHLKDRLDLESCRTFSDVEREVRREIRYYNCERPQWDLMKMPPVDYRRHLVESKPGFLKLS
jgi:putative transposase